jgi:signal transduction histidine kinase
VHISPGAGCALSPEADATVALRRYGCSIMRRLPVPAVDILVALLCLALAWAELLVWNEWSPESRVLQAGGVTVVCSSLAIRRRFPFATVAVAAFGSLITLVGGVPPQILGVGLAAMVISYSFAAALDDARLFAAATMFMATWLIRDIVDPQLNGGDIAIDGVFFGMPFIVGRVVRRRERQVELVSRVAEDRTDDAIRQERARIARELHDVIAHGMSVMVVQADAARHGLAAADQETHAALAEIERTGRESLREMRRLVGLLRDGDESAAALQPQPGLTRVDALVQSIRQAGLPVELRVSGEVRPLPPGVDIAAYRIVQEALTNALRHAGPARATVDIGYDDRQITLRIEDTGRANGATRGAGGNGLVGMRERALLYGGSFDAGRAPDGFVVSASLPLEATR